MTCTLIGIYILSQQVDFAYALFGQADTFCNHIIKGTAHFRTAGERHNAVGAILAAAFHNRDKSTRAINTWLWQVIELLDFREGDINDGDTVNFGGIDHLWHTVQGLRAKHHIDMSGTFANCFAFLTGDTATDPDNQVRFFLFQLSPATELVEKFFLCFFTHRAGVDEQDISFFRIVGQLQFVGFAK